MDIQNSVPTFPVYQLSDVNVTLYAYTYMDAPTRQVTAVIGTSPCASPEHITPGKGARGLVGGFPPVLPPD